MSKNQELLDYTLKLGCCYNCSVRYLCDRSVDFADVKSFLLNNNYITQDENEAEVAVKKCKTNPCIVCLGLLQDFCIESITSDSELQKVKEYDSKVFSCSISMPACILIREHSLKLHLKEEFPNFYSEDKEEVQLNKAWKMFIKNKLKEHINKEFENSDTCEFSVNISVCYEDDIEELNALLKMQPKIFKDRTTQHRKYNGELYSRKAVISVLAVTGSSLFKQYVKVPPEVPTKSVKCKNIECKHNPIYMAGRYCKFSRNLSQSPWIIDGVKTMETSVQEIIFEKIFQEFGIPDTSLKFAASGREDCDVRCLGKGRPFYIEFLDPKKTSYTFEELRKLENSINDSPLIKVTDLQKVLRSELVKIKEGEESKTKNYTALCVATDEVTEEIINKINQVGSVDITQKTPIRVLHRRPLAERNKKIHSMEAKLIPGHKNLFELYVQTQAGTYVKEFVHGDFGRTVPNIGQIIGVKADIMALDVTAINLDWPKELNYEK